MWHWITEERETGAIRESKEKKTRTPGSAQTKSFMDGVAMIKLTSEKDV